MKLDKLVKKHSTKIVLFILGLVIGYYLVPKLQPFTLGSQISEYPIKCNKKLLLVPNSDGYWNKTDEYPLHKSLWQFAKTSTIQPIAYGKSTEHIDRQNELYDTILENDYEVILGHSEGGARVLHCIANNKLDNIKNVILISPAYSTKYLGAVDIDSIIKNLQNISVLLIDTDTGWGGSRIEDQWKERVKLTEAIEKNQFGDKSSRVFISGSDHYLKKGHQTGMEYIINFINN